MASWMLTLVAARIRTSTLMVVRPPSRENWPSCKTCSSLACSIGGISPISSSRMVPLLHSSNLPGLARSAPVKAPGSYPNSSDSSNSAGRAAQFTFRNVRCAVRQLGLWSSAANAARLGARAAGTTTGESQTTMAEIRSGCRAASSSAVIPPMLWPTMTGFDRPSSPHSQATSSAKPAIV